MPRPSSSDRARRLLALLPYLSEQRAIPLAQLAEITGTDAATVASDITVLSMCGGGAGDPLDLVGVCVDGDVAEVFAELPALDRPVRLTPVEARALVTALEVVGVDPASDLAKRLASVGAQEPDLSEVARTVRAAFAQGGHAAVIAALSAAASERVSVRIAYEPADGGPPVERVVRPYTLYLWRGSWYLLAFCEKAHEERTFRVDRISSIASTGKRFERPADLPASPGPLPDLDSLPRATVRFATDAPDLNDRDWPGARFERAGDGSVTAKVPYAGTTWLSRKVAARLGSAQVLFPEELRHAVAEAARKILEELPYKR
jgi:predicted DNA-binding transcriptional regulator YafY